MTTDPTNIAQANMIDKVLASIAALDNDIVATKDDCLTAMMFAARLREIAKDLSAKVEAGVIAWINRNGEIVDGTVRYYVGVTKTTKCTSVKDALEAILEASGGDMDAVVACMSTGAWKHGACSKLLPKEVYDALFVAREEEDIKEGKPAKPDKLQKFDSRFIVK